MLMFFGGRGPWWVSPLLLVVSVVLSNGPIFEPVTRRAAEALPASNLGRVLGGSIFSFPGLPALPTLHGYLKAAAVLAIAAYGLMGITAMAFGVGRMRRWQRAIGRATRAAFRGELMTPQIERERLRAERARVRAEREQARGGGRRTRATIEQVAEAIRKLPTVEYVTDAQLRRMRVHDLKEHADARGIDPSLFLEKSELLARLLTRENSTAETCVICSEDYISGDVLRVLACSHSFHVECVDRWLLACDFSRPPACPMCKSEVLPPPLPPQQPQQQRQQPTAAR
ncbi:hypothetical protein FOA52_004687 [Chlamydomonas sp. UWO 241]|nr:hypothetical protein FOA52_004687 [Chlamydomonas sp. UWO 241]